ncbi:hypothetical protein PUR71_38725 [Streptomyces sp. SP17BM10]|uniref:hypothetical protein n=1 Tax=Streptomyces sp. SP17BM10 TaxID=3002530 RepID=UPI002E79F77E|nr:hypothetical protein [Streptomyces sp. SP17BM10]MEE1788794.1 hypothetical protein [Streptomyces sp. SP17BM10]
MVEGRHRVEGLGPAVSEEGIPLRWSFEAEDDAFMAWLTGTLTGRTSTMATGPADERR